MSVANGPAKLLLAGTSIVVLLLSSIMASTSSLTVPRRLEASWSTRVTRIIG